MKIIGSVGVRASLRTVRGLLWLSLVAACEGIAPAPLDTVGVAGSPEMSAAGLISPGRGGMVSTSMGVAPPTAGSGNAEAAGAVAVAQAGASGGVTGGASGAASGAPSAGGGTGVGGSSAAGGAPGDLGLAGGSSVAAPMDHCLYGYDPQPTDETMADGPAEFFPPGNMDPAIVDTTLQPEVIQWMENNSWQVAHIEWHAIRACSLPGGGGALSKVDICRFIDLIPLDQNCQTAGDGYQFLLFHRHMIQALKQLWPKHTEQFEGFATFPETAEDVPPQWRSAWRDWDPEVLEAGRLGDAIAEPENLARFPDEGSLGFWLQCNVGQRLTSPANDMPFVGLHFLLHAKWARPGNTRHGVNNTEANIDNYMFWKLHGWIDNVWEKYRVAKGLTQEDPKYQADLLAQCREMDTEIRIIQQNLEPDDLDAQNEPLPVESGYFHESVRPIFESQTNLCSGCHAETGANAALSLGGHISSRDIVNGLVNQPSLDGGQFPLVVPGEPEKSWLYLKASGTADEAGCTTTDTAQCITGVMPPSAADLPTVSTPELAILRQWILDGAEGPP